MGFAGLAGLAYILYRLYTQPQVARFICYHHDDHRHLKTQPVQVVDMETICRK